MKNVITLLLVLTVISSCKPKHEPQTEKVSQKTASEGVDLDRKIVMDATPEASYMVDAYANGLFAIRAAEIMKQKAKNKEIKNVAEKIANTHIKILDEINELASIKKISLPSNLNQRQISELKNLEKTPANLEKEFLSKMVKEHQEDVQVLEKLSKESEDNEISTLAIACLATVKDQYEEVVAVKQNMNL